jgi:hypothetical protein
MDNTYLTSIPDPVTHMWKRRGVYSFLMGKKEGKRPLGGLRSRWEDIKMDNTYFTSIPVPLTHMGKRRGVYSFLLRKPEGKRPLGRLRRRWQNIKMDLQEVGCGAWTGSIWLRIETGGGHV